MTLKRFVLLGVLVFVGIASWQIIAALSSDALSMAVGVLFGILAGVPTALLVLAGNRRQERDTRGESHGAQHQAGGYGPPYPQQPPVIVLTGAHGAVPYAGTANQQLMGEGTNWGAQPRRRFHVVGEEDAPLEEW